MATHDSSGSIRGEGTTASERFLFAQSRRSYLQLWSYANVFRDQGRIGGGDGKELCDVMLVFGNSVVLFSDKECKFPDTGNLELDWKRWERRAISASRKQLAGAERWIRRFPDRIFLDRRCTTRLPIAFPEPDKLRIHKVAVALGAADRFRREKGGSGSLFQCVVPPSSAEGALMQPFMVSIVEDDGTICHILDDATLPVLLREIDTLPDLLEYLEAKETLVRGGNVVGIAGEEELVGLFLGLRANVAGLSLSREGKFIIGEGLYARVLRERSYRSYVDANVVSYFWDEMIRHHSACVVNGTLAPGSVRGIQANEEILRLLAAQPRRHRRILSMAYLEFYQKDRVGITSRTCKGFGDVMFVFRICPRHYGLSRAKRQQDLLNYCFLTAWRNRDVKKVVGICSSGGPLENHGYDVTALEVLDWNDEAIEIGSQLEESFRRVRSVPPRSTRWNNRQPRPWDPMADLRIITPFPNGSTSSSKV